jgi:hypothetical protein
MCPWGDGAREKVFFGEKVGRGKKHFLSSRCVLGEMGLGRKCSPRRRWVRRGDESSRMDSGQGGNGSRDGSSRKIHNTLQVF